MIPIKKAKRTTGFILFLIQNHFTVKKTKRQNLMLKDADLSYYFQKIGIFSSKKDKNI